MQPLSIQFISGTREIIFHRPKFANSSKKFDFHILITDSLRYKILSELSFDDSFPFNAIAPKLDVSHFRLIDFSIFAK